MHSISNGIHWLLLSGDCPSAVLAAGPKPHLCSFLREPVVGASAWLLSYCKGCFFSWYCKKDTGAPSPHKSSLFFHVCALRLFSFASLLCITHTIADDGGSGLFRTFSSLPLASLAHSGTKIYDMKMYRKLKSG